MAGRFPAANIRVASVPACHLRCPLLSYYWLAGWLGTVTGASVLLNYIIVLCRDQQRSAAFLTGMLGMLAVTRFADFS